MTEDRLVSLIFKRLSEELLPEEAMELEGWAQVAPENREFLNTHSRILEKEINRWRRINPAQGYTKWLQYRRAQRGVRILRISGWSVAASVLIAVAVFGLTGKLNPSVQRATTPMTAYRVPPGRNTATLTLSNGHQIVLDSAAKGELATQGHTHFVKDDDESISYEDGVNGVPMAMNYNILATPRSGQYQLRLPDGSHVWLNNESSLRYPTSFQVKYRMVELTGEAYFEVAQDPNKPFIVKLRDEAVEVLGTSFNIMAYPEEGGAQTTLLSGAVRVKSGTFAVELKPDEQSLVSPDGSLKVTKDVPSQDIISWKNGFFYFGRATFAAVMRQLARWYDVEVVYEGKAPDMEFGGKIDRSLPLNDVLKFLDKNQIHLRLEGRKLIVLPN
jgi:transmembrane sensor